MSHQYKGIMKTWEMLKEFEQTPSIMIRCSEASTVQDLTEPSNYRDVKACHLLPEYKWHVLLPVKMKTVMVTQYANVYEKGVGVNWDTKEQANQETRANRIACVKLTGTYEVEE